MSDKLPPAIANGRGATATQLASLVLDATRQLRQAARALHDQTGSQLAALGLQLQLLRMDFPQGEQQLAECSETLAEVGGQIRNLMMELDPLPVGAAGLQATLLQLAERFRRTYSVGVEIDFRLQVPVSRNIAEDICWLLVQIVQAASQAGAKGLVVRLSGSQSVTVRIVISVGRRRGTSRAFEPVRHLARSAGFSFGLRTGNTTVITIRHVRR